MKPGYAVYLLLCVAGLSSCSHYLADVSLNDAMTQYGRINSDDLPIGTVLLWNRKTNEINQIPSIPHAALTLERVPETGTEDQIAIKGVSETDITVSTPPLSNLPALDKATAVGIQAAVGSETHLQLDQYFNERYLTRYDLPNDPSTVTWRQQNLSDKYIDPDLIFVFVVADTTSGKAQFYSGTPTDDKGNSKPLDNSITLGGNKIVDVSYSGGSSINKTGAGIPSVVKYQYFILKKDNEGATHYHFDRIHDQQTDDDFAQVLRRNAIN
jgi:hypothetical protein